MFREKLMVLTAIAAITLSFGTAVFATGKGETKETVFKVRVENIADAAGISAQNGSRYPFALSPGFYIVSDRDSQIFSTGKKASPQLEAQAEDGNPSLFFKKYLTRVGSIFTGVFDKPLGSNAAAPIFSGGAFEFEVYGKAGMKLNLAFMYGQSNDLFYAPDRAIALFDEKGNPVNGDITDQLKLWDAGTEVNQAPGLGADQGPRQKGPNTGTAENGLVRLVSDGFTYPDTRNVLRVTITAR